MWANRKALAGVILVFLLGCLAGGLASSVFFIHRSTVFLQRGAPAYMELLERRLGRGIHLGEDQKDQIHQIFMKNLDERKKLQAQIQPQVQELNHATLRQIRQVLRPDQEKAFERNLDDFRHRFGHARFGVAPDNATAPEDQGGTTNAAPGQPANP